MDDFAKFKNVGSKLILHLGDRLISVRFDLFLQRFLNKVKIMRLREVKARIVLPNHPLTDQSDLDFDVVAFEYRLNFAVQLVQIHTDLAVIPCDLGRNDKLSELSFYPSQHFAFVHVNKSQQLQIIVENPRSRNMKALLARAPPVAHSLAPAYQNLPLWPAMPDNFRH